jgi:hypothetical protein
MLLAYLLRGSLMTSLFVALIVFISFITLFLSGFAGAVLFLFRRAVHPSVIRTSFISSLICLASFIFIYASHKWIENDISEAKNYVASILPSLDSYKLLRGHFPKQLSEISGLPSVPRIASKDKFYQMENDKYTFVISYPSSMFSSWHFDSETREWIFND